MRSSRKVLEAVKKREQAEEKLLRAQKMEAIGHLTGGVAHDFNNLLQVIAGNLELRHKDMRQRKAEPRSRSAIIAVARGASSPATPGLRPPPAAGAGGGQSRPPRPRHGRDLLHRTLGETIEIETIVDAGLWNTFVDPSQVENAILNLAINARDAMPGGGKLTIEVGQRRSR